MASSQPNISREFIIKVILEDLPQLVKESDLLKGAIISALSGVVATKEDIENLGKQTMESFRETDKRLADLKEEMDKRFEAMDKRFAEMREETNKRFEAMDKRFEAMDKRLDRIETQQKSFEERTEKRFDSLERKMDHLIDAIGKPFEQFGRNVIIRILEGEGITAKLEQKRIPNPYLDLFNSTELEFDGYSDEPAVIAEITTVLSDNRKLLKFIEKKTALEKITGKQFRGFFVCSSSRFTQEEKADAILLLKKHNSELINL